MKNIWISTKKVNFGPIRTDLGQIWAQRQISRYVIIHLFKVFIMLWLLVKKSGKNIEHFRWSTKNVGFSPILGMIRSVTPEPEFFWTFGFCRIVSDIMLHNLKPFSKKLNDKIFRRIRKNNENRIFHHFFPNSQAPNSGTRIFSEMRFLQNRASN